MSEDKFLPDRFKAVLSAMIGAEDTETLTSALLEEPETAVRLNARKPYAGTLYEGMTQVPWCRSGYYLSERPRFTFNPLLHAGAFYVQDPSSMVYERIVSDLVGDTPVMAADLCAAPGGKTTAILNALPDGSALLANEFVASRASILRENLCKYGYPDVLITNTDVGRLSKMKGFFELVAVDAPCSGEGMMRKEEAARKQWSEGLVRQCAALQREILSNAVEMLAPGGYLIYSTCTFNTFEDEDNAAWIRDDLGLTPVDTGLAGLDGIKPQASGDVPCLRFMPGFTRGEGLFVAVFRKDDDGCHCSGREKKSRKSDRKGKGKRQAADRALMEKAASWINTEAAIIPHEERLLAVSPAVAALLDSVPKDVRIISAGIEVGEVKGKDLIPSHQLAMSVEMSHPFPEVELSEEKALLYLSKEAIALPPDTPRGFVTATFKGLPLGFLKNHGNRSNNLYPSEYRIKTYKH